MMKIPINKIDELSSICVDLEILTYIELLIQDDVCDTFKLYPALQEGKKNALHLIQDMQLKTICNFHNLINEITS